MTKRERQLNRKIRDVWTELLKERSDHTRAAQLHRQLDELKQQRMIERAKGDDDG